MSRKYPRFNSINLVSVLEVSQEQLQESGQLGTTINLSEGGILFESTYPFPILATVQISLTLKEEVLEFLGRIIRLEELENKKILVGLEFLEISPKTKKILDEYLAEKQKK